MSRGCSVSGKPGHNARTCGSAGAPSASPRAAKPSKAPASEAPSGSVQEQLERRLAKLEDEAQKIRGVLEVISTLTEGL